MKRAEIPPALASESALLEFLGVGRAEYLFLQRFAAYRYRSAMIPKRKGGVRTLMVPDDRLKFIQRKLLELLEPLYNIRAPVHGFVKGRGAISNAASHQARPYLLNVDLENYFGSVTRNRVRGVIASFGCWDVANFIAAICVVDNSLPQGAPTSPILANMVSYKLDREMMAFAKTHRLRYTRYADDMSFSSFVQPVALFANGLPAAGLSAPEALSEEFRNIIESNGFKINANKIRFADRKSRKEVTGLVVNEFVNVRRKSLRNIRAGIYTTEQVGITTAQERFSARRGADASLEQNLRGQLEWLSQVRGKSFGAYRTLAARFNKLYPAKPLIIEPTYEEIGLHATYVIEFGDGDEVDMDQGTAFLLDGVGLVTAYHVIEKLRGKATVYQALEPDTKYQAWRGPILCARRDLAVLQHTIPPERQVSVKAGEIPARGRQSLSALGFPNHGPEDQLSVRPGHLVGRFTRDGVRMIEVDATLTGGMSGGPIVNDRYEVIAVTYKGGAEAPKQLAIHIGELLDLVDEERR